MKISNLKDTVEIVGILALVGFRGTAPMPGVALFWKDRRHYFNESFRDYLEALMKSSGHDPSLWALSDAGGEEQ